MSDKEQRIRVRAYDIWERDGCRDGRAEDHWREAESEIERESAELAAQSSDGQEQPKKRAGKGQAASASRVPEATMSATGERQGKGATGRVKTSSGAAVRRAEMGRANSA